VAGGYSPTETVNLIAYHTDSSSAANTYKFVTHQLGFTTIAVNQEFNLKIKGDYTKTYTQSVAAATWTINHNSNRFPSVTTVDNSGAVIEGAVTYLNANQLTVQFSPAVAGKAYLN
jgi:hypothetical protein